MCAGLQYNIIIVVYYLVLPCMWLYPALSTTLTFIQLQARIQSQLLNKPGLFSNVPGGTEKPQASSKPTPLILDQEGRTVDNLGRTIQLSVRQPTLKVLT